jgi:hypothetical protein
MPADASIFSQYLQPVRSVQDYGADLDKRNLLALQLQGQQGQNALLDITRQQQMQDSQRKQSGAALLQRLASGWTAQTPMADRVASLRNAGHPDLASMADAMETQDIARRKGEGEIVNTAAEAGSRNATAAKTTQETQISARRDAYASAASLNTPEDAIASLNAAVSAGKVPMQVAVGLQKMVQSDPLWKLKLMQGALDPEKLKEALMPHFQLAGGAMVNTNPLAGAVGQGQPNAIPITQDADSIASNATTRYTAGLTDARERSKVKYETDGNGNLVSLPEIAPAGGIVKAGAVTAPGPGMVPLPGKDQTLNDSQAKSYLFGDRMQAANKIIADMAGKGVTRSGNINALASALPLVGGIADSATNITQSPEQQQVKQAKLDFMTAALRRESGASIAPSEFETFDKAYFPQLNDDNQTIANKAALRQRAIDGVLTEVPQNKRPKGSGVTSAPPKPGAVLKFDAQGNLLP